MAIAAFIDRVGCATSEQIRRRFGLSEPMCWRRLRALRESGRVRSSRPLVSGNLVAGPLFHAGAFALLGVGAAAIGVLLMVLASRARPAMLRPGPAA